MSNLSASAIDQRTRTAAVAVLRGQKRARITPFLGPAVVASVAYMDPGNFATNMEAGGRLGYALLWVVLASSLMAVVVQTLSAKLGIATGRNLPELIREHWPRPVVWFYWIQAEVVAMFTDLAEFLGAVLGFHLLAGFSMLASVALSFTVVMAILGLEQRGFRPLEIAVGVLVGVVALAYTGVLARSPVDWGAAAHHVVMPGLGGSGAEGLYLACGILGATVMPHVIYLHSSLTQNRIAVEEPLKPCLMRMTLREVLLALGVAGLINMAMLVVAAANLRGSAAASDGLTQAWRALQPLLGTSAAALFALALLASGISSAVVGTMSGQVVMQGFVNFTIPIWMRRLLTTLPALLVVLIGIDPQRVLVLSQVVLSFGIPFALVPLLVFTGRRSVMGALTNSSWLQALGWVIASTVIALNVWLTWTLF